MNVGTLCTTEVCDRGLADKIAMHWVLADGGMHDYTFRDLEAQTNTVCDAFTKLGLPDGGILFILLPKMPEVFTCFLGGLKAGLTVGTLFPSFGEDALYDRLSDSRCRCVVTKKSLLKKLMKIRDKLPDLQRIVVMDIPAHVDEMVLSLSVMEAEAEADGIAANIDEDAPATIHYTSGSTGKPKGVLHRHGAVAQQAMTTRAVLSLTDDDIFWCTADHAWVTGTSYGIIGPWSNGITQVHYAGGFDVEKWLSVLERQKVTVWYTAPTALRMFLREDPAIFSKYDLSRLRHICSVGEPLNPEIITWGRRVLGKEIYDTWFQTETGAISIANRPGLTVKPGSMGTPVANIEAAILDDAGNPVPAGQAGNLCLKAGWPSMFIDYIHNRETYLSKFRAGWYYTGDSASMDEEGYVWFEGRKDDVINTAGHLVSPFEVESALLEVPEIAESAAVGVPDELLYEKVVTFIALKQGVVASQELELKIRLYVSNRVSTVATPQDIVFVESIPKNISGKIMRRVLKCRYLGLEEGDTSTMEKMQ